MHFVVVVVVVPVVVVVAIQMKKNQIGDFTDEFFSSFATHLSHFLQKSRIKIRGKQEVNHSSLSSFHIQKKIHTPFQNNSVPRFNSKFSLIDISEWLFSSHIYIYLYIYKAKKLLLPTSPLNFFVTLKRVLLYIMNKANYEHFCK